MSGNRYHNDEGIRPSLAHARFTLIRCSIVKVPGTIHRPIYNRMYVIYGVRKPPLAGTVVADRTRLLVGLFSSL